MPDMIGNIAVPEIAASGVFPLTADYPIEVRRDHEVVIHQFGSGNAKIEQRFLLGTGARRFSIRKQWVRDADRIALRNFWETKYGPYGAFTFNAPNDDGAGTTPTTCRFANEPLSWEMVADWACSLGVILIEIPTGSPSYTLNQTVNRFPSASLQTALLSQVQEIIPLVRIQPLESGYPAIHLSDRRCTIDSSEGGGQLYQARLLKFDGISQSIGNESDEAQFSFGNADRVMRDLANDVDLFRAEIAFSLFHVGTGIKLDLWKGNIVNWSCDAGPEFRIKAADGLYELNLPYPTRRISRTCWKPFKDASATTDLLDYAETLFEVDAAVAAASICDEQVAKIVGTGNETQFKFRGVLQEEKPFRDWLQEVLMNCLGYYTFANGKVKLGVRVNSSAVEAFTEGNILFRSLQLAPLRPSFNHLTANFADEDFEFVANSISLYDIDHAALLGGAGRPLFLKSTVNLAGTASKSQAARLITVRLREELGGLTPVEWKAARQVGFKTTVLALNTEPGMVRPATSNCPTTTPRTSSCPPELRTTTLAASLDRRLGAVAAAPNTIPLDGLAGMMTEAGSVGARFMIHSVLVSGDLDDERLYRILGELAGLAMAATPDPELVLVIESNGGSCLSLRSFLECVNADDRTRKALARGGVKIYNAQSAAAVIALSFGRHREMVAGSQIGLHLPLLPVDLIDVDKDNRLVGIPFENCRKTVEVVEEVMERFGLDEPKPQSEIHESGWLRLPALECLKRGVVHRIFGGDGPAVDSGDCAERPAHSETVGRTILISGTLTEQRLGLVLRELLAVAAQESTVDGEVVLVFESNAGELFSTLAFMDEVAQNESLRHLVERARVKIYEACPPAALLAFSWGRIRELAVDAKIQFSLGQLTLQMGNPNQLAADGLLSAQLCKDWRRYRSTVEQLTDRLGLTHDPKLSAKLYACGRLTLTAEDCLKRGIVSRLF